MSLIRQQGPGVGMPSEISHPGIGGACLEALMNMAIAFVNDVAMIESSPWMEGKQMYLLLAPDPAGGGKSNGETLWSCRPKSSHSPP